MMLVLQLVALAVFCWILTQFWRVHRTVIRHWREWVTFTGHLLKLVPDEGVREDQSRQAAAILRRQIDELRAVRAWPFPIRLD
jgi:hypothetical protein